MKYADVSDVDLYQGNMRFDVNLSLAPTGSDGLGTRTETKNLNSFKAVEKAAAYEIKRQTELLDKGQKIVQETRGWDDAKQKTVTQRAKEEAHDYRYFPDPDIPPVEISPEQINRVKKEMPKLPEEIRGELLEIGLDAPRIETLLEYPELIALVSHVSVKDKAAGKFTANLITNVWLAEMDESHANLLVSTSQLLALYSLTSQGKLSSTNAKALFLALQKVGGEKDAHELAKEMNLIQVSDTDELDKIVDQVISENPQAAEDVRNGEMKAIGFLTGQVMKLSRGQANPAKVQELLKQKLS
jgi:aspartyl-tRNA(Asn)/glutamyl-tRNA(Gln) amidotransferase subunit B